MNIEQLTKIGAIVPALPQEEEIEWTQVDYAGEEQTYTATVFVRRLAYADQERMLKLCGYFDRVEEGEDVPEDKSTNSALIAIAVRFGDEAQEALTYEQACCLHPALAHELILAITKVNPTAKKKP